MRYSTGRLTIALLCAALLATPAVAGVKFTTSWKAPGASARQMAGNTVAVVALTDDPALRTAAEEAMARALAGHGVVGEASHRVIPNEELGDRAKAQAWFLRRDVRVVITLRVVDVEAAQNYSPIVWTTAANYRSFHDYYAGGRSSTTRRATQESKVALELLAFAVRDGGLVWGGTCEVKDPPKDLEAFARNVVDAAVGQMRKQGLLVKAKAEKKAPLGH